MPGAAALFEIVRSERERVFGGDARLPEEQ
jgi:hypothetical protein